MDTKKEKKYNLYKATLKSTGQIYIGADQDSRTPKSWFNQNLGRAKTGSNKSLFGTLLIDNPEFDQWNIETILSKVSEEEVKKKYHELVKSIPIKNKINKASSTNSGDRSTPSNIEIPKSDTLSKGEELWIKKSVVDKYSKRLEIDPKNTLSYKNNIYVKLLKGNNIKLIESSKSIHDKINELKTLMNMNESNGSLSYKVNVSGESFNVKFDVNKNPTKKGIKIQFQPSKILDDTTKNELINKIQDILNKKMEQYQIEVDYDQDVPDKNIIGFYIKLGDISDFIINAFKV